MTFEKGNKTGKRGRPKGGSLRAAAEVEYSRSVLRASILKLITMPADKVASYLQSPACTAGEAMVAAIILQAIKRGDPLRAEALWRRVIGPVPKEVVISEVEPTIIRRSNGDEIELGMRRVDAEDRAEVIAAEVVSGRDGH